MSLRLILALPLVLAAAGAARADCTCRYQGTSLKLGERVCMSRGDTRVLMECAMNQNVSSWRKVADGCPSAAIPAPPVALALSGAAVLLPGLVALAPRSSGVGEPHPHAHAADDSAQ
jgi:hypothetical protein